MATIDTNLVAGQIVEAAFVDAVDRLERLRVGSQTRVWAGWEPGVGAIEPRIKTGQNTHTSETGTGVGSRERKQSWNG